MADAANPAPGAAQPEPPLPNLIVNSAMRTLVAEFGFRTGGDLYNGLNKVLADFVEQACNNATKAGRQTVRAEDLPQFQIVTG
jgi:histone H3/H4